MNSDSLDTNEFIVLSVPWKIREIPGGDVRIDDCCGKASFDAHIIFLAAEMPYEERVETLIHEVFHILANGRERVDLTKEDTLRTFSMMLTDVLIRNGLIPT